MSSLFHLAFPVDNLNAAKTFYVDGLGCVLGRSSAHSLILNFMGNQLVAQLTNEEIAPQKSIYPRHFGLIFSTMEEWQQILRRCQDKKLKFRIEPKHRHPGEITEHHTFFIEDPANNLLEFKYYLHEIAIFGALESSQIGDWDELTGSS